MIVMGRRRRSLQERFFQNFGQPNENGCRIWTGGSFKKSGYGRICEGGDKGKTIYAHRLSWTIHYGDIPSGLCVLHRCDVRMCVNPDHLFLGTNAENMADKVAKGRQSRQSGESNPSAKLTKGDVEEIRRRYSSGLISQETLAEYFGVSQTLIGMIVRERIWKNVG